jgi:hypothetical protein
LATKKLFEHMINYSRKFPKFTALTEPFDLSQLDDSARQLVYCMMYAHLSKT